MRPQDSVALRHRSTQLLAIKGQLRQKVDALKKELETKRKSNTPRTGLDDGNGESGNREHPYSEMGMGGKFRFDSIYLRKNCKFAIYLEIVNLTLKNECSLWNYSRS